MGGSPTTFWGGGRNGERKQEERRAHQMSDVVPSMVAHTLGADGLAHRSCVDIKEPRSAILFDHVLLDISIDLNSNITQLHTLLVSQCRMIWILTSEGEFARL